MDNHRILLGGVGWSQGLLPGAHVAVLSEQADLDGFRGRQAGLELRDTLLVLSPGVMTRFVLLFRKPCAENTVAEQVLATGTGGINVDGCRVSTSDSLNGGAYSLGGRAAPMTGDNRTGASLGMFQPGKAASGDYTQPSGRWPPNVLLVHGPRCRAQGTKQVKNVGGSSSGESAFGQNSGWNKHNNRTTEITRNRDQDGLETVPNWDCQEDCPVRLLDEQTGELKTNPGRITSDMASMGFHGGIGSSRVVVQDSGGASRFFPQFKNDTELVAWLRRLIAP